MGNATVIIALGPDYDATRAAGIKSRLATKDGVNFVDFNYTNNKLTVKFDPDRASFDELKAIFEQEKKHRAGLFQRRASKAELKTSPRSE
jgi:allophanate hydrolase subunit 1